jgi:hypothetical protein
MIGQVGMAIVEGIYELPIYDEAEGEAGKVMGEGIVLTQSFYDGEGCRYFIIPVAIDIIPVAIDEDRDFVVLIECLLRGVWLPMGGFQA